MEPGWATVAEMVYVIAIVSASVAESLMRPSSASTRTCCVIGQDRTRGDRPRDRAEASMQLILLAGDAHGVVLLQMIKR